MSLQSNMETTEEFYEQRQFYTMSELNEKYFEKRSTEKENWNQRLRRKLHCSSKDATKAAKNLFPIIAWVKDYNLKKFLLADVVAGLTVAMFNVPQSLASTLLASVPPVFALYNAIFPAIMYAIFGTVRHASVGAEITTSIMVGATIRRLVKPDSLEKEIKYDSGNFIDKEDPLTYTVENVSTTLCFIIGVIQTLFSLLRLGSLSVFISEQLVNGFATGVAVQVAVSQLPSVFGLHLKQQTGIFSVIRTLILFCEHICETNLVALSASIVSIGLILFVKIKLDPSLIRKFGIPIPVELISVILLTLASSTLELGKNYKIRTVGFIPGGQPVVTYPIFDMELIRDLMGDALEIAIVGYAITLSLGRLFSQKHDYEVDTNQEFLALGASHIFGSFFSCFPVAASVPRSAVQEDAGGKTQLVSIVNSIVILLMLLYFGHHLEHLPVCVLSSIVITSLRKIVLQIDNFKRYWSLSKIDGQVWMISFASTVIFDVTTGLIIGIVFSLLTLLFKLLKPKTYLLGNIPETEFFAPIKSFQNVQKIPGVTIMHVVGAIHFANADYFKQQFFKKLGFSLSYKQSSHGKNSKISNGFKSMDSSKTFCEFKVFSITRKVDKEAPSLIILDFSSVTWLDGCSGKTLSQIVQDLAAVNIRVLLACCSSSVLSLLNKGGIMETIGKQNIFPAIYDALAAHIQNKHD